MHYFLDSSALIKRYITEQGTVLVRSITLPSAGHTIILAQVTQVEIVSGVFRRRREGLSGILRSTKLLYYQLLMSTD